MHQNEKTKVYLRIGPSGRLPLYATPGSAGCDLFAATDIILRPGETKVLPLDLVMAIEQGIEAQIRPRSGLSLKTALRLSNSPGTIDSDYRSSVGVILQNAFSSSDLIDRLLADPGLPNDLAAHYRKISLADYLDSQQAGHANQIITENFSELAGQIIYIDQQGNPYGTIYIKTGDRIAQMVFTRYLQGEFIEHPDPESIGHNRGGGFGSTGK